MSDLHQRICYSCKFTGMYESDTLPGARCTVCDSADTRRVKVRPPNVPQTIMPCCDEWRRAQESGSGNEAFGVLVRDLGNGPQIGSELRPVRFCPWCGHDKSQPTALEKAAKNVVDALSSNGEWEDLQEAIHALSGLLPRGEHA